VTPIDPELLPPTLTAAEKLEATGLTIEELRTLLNEDA
jgi:hypothetical protein